MSNERLVKIYVKTSKRLSGGWSVRVMHVSDRYFRHLIGGYLEARDGDGKSTSTPMICGCCRYTIEPGYMVFSSRAEARRKIKAYNARYQGQFKIVGGLH